MITGKDLIALGYEPGSWFGAALTAVNNLADPTEMAIREAVEAVKPAPVPRLYQRHRPLPYEVNVLHQTEEEFANVTAVRRHMEEIMRLPTVVDGAIMPDCCPAGSAPGTIPVGGVVVTEDSIHPGMHSADICCSVALTSLGDVDPKDVLDAGMKLTHFGGGGRPRGQQINPPDWLLERFGENPFLRSLRSDAIEHFATQGDGNHFFYVGTLASTGATVIVTHHGSRRPGAMLYKKGLEAAVAYTSKVAPDVARHNAWLQASSPEGVDYWEALQLIREWTKRSHFAIHDMVVEEVGAGVKRRFWNEHNFVFRRDDGRFYHAKGATPSFDGFAEDDSGLTLIPLNMAQPILITAHTNTGIGFAPHGAGRNFSRTAHIKKLGDHDAAEVVARETAGIDCRFFSGVPDVSELPSAYKDAAAVQHQIEHFGLARIVDVVSPYGCIMAGDWQVNAPWRKKSARRRAEEVVA